MLINITPAGLGFREAVVAYGALATGATTDVGLAAAILDLLIMTILVIVIAQVAIFRIVPPSGPPADATGIDQQHTDSTMEVNEQ